MSLSALPHAVLSICMLVVTGGISAQQYTSAERLQGYALRGDTAVFLFDEALYDVRPTRVLLEGGMRGWQHDMEDAAWALAKSAPPRVWELRKTSAKEFVNARFKYRIDTGEWMNPPASATNVDAGNLVFEPSAPAPEFRAEIVAARHIRFYVLRGDASPSLDPAHYRLRRADGSPVPIAAVFWTGSRMVHVYPAEDLDIRRVYYLIVHGHEGEYLCSFDGWMRHCYTDAKLGAHYESERDATTFRVMAPRADSVALYLYRGKSDAAPERRVPLARRSDGAWEIGLPGKLEGWWYDFTVHGPPDPGNEFYEQKPVHISDPWATVSDDSFGRSRVRALPAPPPPIRGGRPRMEDVVAYEVHVEDFTLALHGLPEEERGSFAGFYRSGLRNTRGDAIGFDYLTSLGINVVHLLPVQEYLHYPDEEWRRAFANDAFMREQMVDSSNYQWGYRTSHAMALESRYRRKGAEPGSQNEDFRDLVAAFHERGIAVIVDLVFNHTAERMDAREMLFHFRVLDRHLWYRTNNETQFIGEYGTETKSEDRPMTARWIYDQCEMLVRDYGVDGFRIDLAGLTDKQTLAELRRRLGPDIIIYGEPWIASSDPDYEANPDWNWYKVDAPITYFQDDTRNALCGPPDSPRDKSKDRGYAGGNGNRDAAKRAIANSFDEEHTPNHGINYLDIHDNWALADRFATQDWNGLLGVEEGPYRIAAALLLTSLGPVVIHGGTEFMRSKGASPLVNIVASTESGPIYIHGKRDTYNLRRPNLFLWETLSLNTTDGAACNYREMAAYWKGLLALRNSAHGKVFRVGHRVPDSYIRWIEPEDPMLLGYVVNETVCVLVNTSAREWRVPRRMLPEGTWDLVVRDARAGTAPIAGFAESVLRDATADVIVPAHGVRIWVRRQ